MRAVVSMDLSKAFDTIPHALLVTKLKAYSMGDGACTLLRDYQKDPSIANHWYKDNGIRANASKHQAMILWRTEHQFSFPVKSSLDWFGMVTNNELNFSEFVKK